MSRDGQTPLTSTEVEMLALERQWFQRAGSKDAVVRDLFGWSATEYFRQLNRLIDRPEALEHDALTVNRLRRLREDRARARRGRRLAG